jgi:hypothetical protein
MWFDFILVLSATTPLLFTRPIASAIDGQELAIGKVAIE